MYFVHLQKPRSPELPKCISKQICKGDPNNIQQSPARKVERQGLGGLRERERSKMGTVVRIVNEGKDTVIRDEIERVHMHEG